MFLNIFPYNKYIFYILKIKYQANDHLCFFSFKFFMLVGLSAVMKIIGNNWYILISV